MKTKVGKNCFIGESGTKRFFQAELIVSPESIFFKAVRIGKV